MASGKSLEMKEFDREHSVDKRRKAICACGRIWESDYHFTKAGGLRKSIARDVNCYPTGRQGLLIKAIAAKQALGE